MQWVEKGNKYSCLQNCPVKARLVMQKHKLTEQFILHAVY
jgi:hypothetical protein